MLIYIIRNPFSLDKMHPNATGESTKTASPSPQTTSPQTSQALCLSDEEAWAERRHQGIPVAEKTLLNALKHFPNEGLLYYNLACYSAVDGRTLEAKSLLSKAIELDPSFKGLALEDEDLAGLW